MQEVGKVTKIDGDYIIVAVPKKDECSKCGMCLFPKGASEINLRAKNTLRTKLGDSVKIETTTSQGKTSGVILVFLIPLLLIGLAVLIEKLFIKNEIFILILSVAFMVLWFIILAFIDKKISKKDKYVAKIIEIIDSEIA